MLVSLDISHRLALQIESVQASLPNEVLGSATKRKGRSGSRIINAIHSAANFPSVRNDFSLLGDERERERDKVIAYFRGISYPSQDLL